jgi:NADPH:quinone reductase-like Zn-dependent oxidoreductase
MLTTSSTDLPAVAMPASNPTAMRAVTQDTYGGPDVLRLGQRPRPVPGAGEVLVEVRAAGLDRGTWHLMAGEPLVMRLVFGLRRPRQPVPGLDVAGVVVEVGEGVTRFRPGDEVLGVGKATWAELAVAKEAKLVAKPVALSFEQAAVLSISGMTALQAVDAGRVAAGRRVLVTGASGGVGSYVVQMAAARGAVVTGVASTPKLEFVRSLGAAEVVDYTAADPLDVAEPYDVIIDLAGNASIRRLRRALAPTGTLVIAGGEQAGRWFGGIDRQLRALLLSPFVRQRLTSFVNRERLVDLEGTVALVTAGEVAPTLDRTFPLGEAAAAMRMLVTGEVRGKVAVVP